MTGIDGARQRCALRAASVEPPDIPRGIARAGPAAWRIAAARGVARQRRVNAVSRGQECVRQALGIERRLGDSRANMRPRDERGVAKEYRSAER